MPIVILKESALPVEAMVALVDSASREGHSFIVRLLSDWSSGENRFTDRGEALFIAWDRSTAVGVLGLNIDPFQTGPRTDAEVARFRHLYVAPHYRGQGIGAELCTRALLYARPTFRHVRLRTPDGRSHPFYEQFGFGRVIGDPKVTYALSITR